MFDASGSKRLKMRGITMRKAASGIILAAAALVASSHALAQTGVGSNKVLERPKIYSPYVERRLRNLMSGNSEFL